MRRGKFLWLPLSVAGVPSSVGAGGAENLEDETLEDYALMAHLGMSGQLLIQRSEHPDEKHLKVRISLDARGDEPEELRFVDQRIFGGLMLSDVVQSRDGLPVGRGDASVSDEPRDDVPFEIPAEAAHIARDPLDPFFDEAVFAAALAKRKTEIKRALLDQTLISGIGNIYADEALWASQIHYATATNALTSAEVARLLESVREVMRDALAAGGTSFDSLYVNVNGSSGYFDRSLHAYGRTGEPCPRCGIPIRREAFMNRSSHFCPRCQRQS